MSDNKKILFTGCSFTAGAGWHEHPDKVNKDSPNLWVNICHKTINQIKNLEIINQGFFICHKTINQIKNLEIINQGSAGASNAEIFENTVANLALYGNDIDTIICQWTSGPRYNFNCGLEQWNTTESIRSGIRQHDVRLSNGDFWPRDYINDLVDRFLVMHHLHWEIVKIVRYANIIKNLTMSFDDVKVYFVNGICPWDKNYFTKLENVLPSEYTEFTKKNILEIDTRLDDDIFFLYDKIHADYADNGGIDQDIWINLYNSFSSNKIDVNFDKKHPGENSNLLYADMIKNFFKKQNEK